MVLKEGSFGPNMALDGHLLAASACQQSSLLAPRDLPLIVMILLMVLAASYHAWFSK